MRISNIRKELIFWDFVYAMSLDIPLADLLNSAYQMKSESQGISVSNVNGWHSELQEEPAQDPLLRRLEEEVRFCCEQVIASEGMALQIKDFYWWVNINPPGGFNRPHNHPKTDLSAVFYAKTPQDGGNLILARTDSAAYGNLYNKVPNGREVSICPEEGTLLIFPAHLWHWVEPNNGQEDRVSITYNIECG